MKKTFKYLMLALVAVLACVSISSCSKDNDEDPSKGMGNYYVQLHNFESNITDAKGNNIAELIKSEWLSMMQADSQGKKVIGKTDNENARMWFNQFVNETMQQFGEIGKTSIPENGYIRFSVSLGSDASYGGANEFATIEITNTGARKL